MRHVTPARPSLPVPLSHRSAARGRPDERPRGQTALGVARRYSSRSTGIGSGTRSVRVRRTSWSPGLPSAGHRLPKRRVVVYGHLALLLGEAVEEPVASNGWRGSSWLMVEVPPLTVPPAGSKSPTPILQLITSTHAAVTIGSISVTTDLVRAASSSGLR